MVTMLFIMAVIALIAIMWLVCWYMAIGPVGHFKREVRFQQARQRADQIAAEARQRINRL